MFFSHNFTIEPEQIPENQEEICFAVAKYCAEKNLDYEFESRGYPIVARINNRRYEIKKQFTKRFGINLWVLRCREIKTE